MYLYKKQYIKIIYRYITKKKNKKQRRKKIEKKKKIEENPVNKTDLYI